MTSRKPPPDESSEHDTDHGANVVDFTAFRARRDRQSRRGRSDHALPSAAELAEATQHPAGSGTREPRTAQPRPLRAVADDAGVAPDPADPRPADANRLRERLRAMEQRATVSPLTAAGSQASGSDDAEALRLGLKLLGSRDLTRRELRERLKSRDVADEAAERAVSELWSRGLIDELDIARRAAEVGTARRHVGMARLRQELRSRGIGAEDIEQALAEVDTDSELEAAVAVALQRLRGLRDVDAQTRRRRVLASLQRKGFPSDLCRRAYSAALDLL